MTFLGQKRQKLYSEFISQYIPDNIKIYVEPFGGSFSVAMYLIAERLNYNTSPKTLIYNDINKYDTIIYADKIHHLDYKEIFEKYDSADTFFYLDPPYYKKEFIYNGCEDYTKNFHLELFEYIKKLKGKFLLSYNNDKFIIELYKDFNVIYYTGNNKIFKNEILIK